MLKRFPLLHYGAHFNLQIGGRVVISGSYRTTNAGKEALFFKGILGQACTQHLNLMPERQIAVRGAFRAVQLLHIDHSLVVFGNQAGQKLRSPTN